MPSKKTNAMRQLDRQKIDYSVVEYTYDPNNLDVGKIAAENDLSLAQVHKTLVLKGDKTGVFVAVIGGHQQLDLKAAAALSGNRKAALLPMGELESVVGYQRGACCPVGMKKSFPVLVDECAQEFAEILINGGQRGLLIRLRLADLLQVTTGKLVNLARSD